jgi:hypothetical protein
MEELAGGSSRSAHHSFPAVTRCHALLRCLFNGTLPLPSAPFPPPPPPHSPFLRRRFWPLFTFPPLPRPLINPPCASAFTSQFSRPSIPLSLLCLYTYTLRDVALLLLLLLLLLHHQKQHTCFLSSSSACLCVSLHSNFIHSHLEKKP